MNKARPIFKISFSTYIALSGVLVIAAYIIFGGSLQSKPSKRKIKRKGLIPGLVNVGNTCYINCILQALSSCHSFVKWIELRASSSAPILIWQLNKIIQILNNKTEDDVACAQSIIEALRYHGWVISSEEQDAHELFHALFSTIDDEIKLLHEQSNSLFNLTWIKDAKEEDKLEKEEWKYEPSVSECFKNAATDYSLLPANENLNSCRSLLSSKQLGKLEGTSIISKITGSSTYLAQLLPNSKPIESPFKGYLASQLICKICGYKGAEQWNTFESLSLSLPNNSWRFQKIFLTDLLEAFVRPELVTDVNCDGCSKLKGSKSLSTFSKQLTIGKLPECLCLHIPRTHWLDNGCAMKRKDFVVIPEILDMAPFTYVASSKILQCKKGGLVGGQHNYDTADAKGNTEETVTNIALGDSFAVHNFNERYTKKVLYKLQAVIVHVGDIVSGHFVTYRRGAINTSSKDRWYYTSDMLVKEVSASEVQQSNMYMAIYEKLTFR